MLGSWQPACFNIQPHCKWKFVLISPRVLNLPFSPMTCPFHLWPALFTYDLPFWVSTVIDFEFLSFLRLIIKIILSLPIESQQDFRWKSVLRSKWWSFKLHFLVSVPSVLLLLFYLLLLCIIVIYFDLLFIYLFIYLFILFIILIHL